MTSNKVQFHDASNPIDLSLPTDIELSRKFAVTIVTALPEDFPGFSPDRLIEHTNIDERIRAVRENLSNRLPFWVADSDNKDWHIIARARAAHLITFNSKTAYEDELRLNGFFILKHSKLVSAEQDLANFTRLPLSAIVSPLTWEEISFLSLHHEKAHIIQRLKKKSQEKDFLTRFKAEWGADSESLFSYLAVQKDPVEQKRVINGWVAMRALSGFLSQPDTYWIAPTLKDAFNRPESRDGILKSSINPFEIRLAYTELRIRTMARLRGSSNMNSWDSNEFRAALSLSEEGRLREIRNAALRFEIEQLDKSFNSGAFANHIKSGAALEALSHITNYANLAPFTRHCAQQIIDGAKLICPSLLKGYVPDVSSQPRRNLG